MSGDGTLHGTNPGFAQMIADAAEALQATYDRESFIAGANQARLLFDIGVAHPGID